MKKDSACGCNDSDSPSSFNISGTQDSAEIRAGKTQMPRTGDMVFVASSAFPEAARVASGANQFFASLKNESMPAAAQDTGEHIFGPSYESDLWSTFEAPTSPSLLMLQEVRPRMSSPMFLTDLNVPLAGAGRGPTFEARRTMANSLRRQSLSSVAAAQQVRLGQALKGPKVECAGIDATVDNIKSDKDVSLEFHFTIDPKLYGLGYRLHHSFSTIVVIRCCDNTVKRYVLAMNEILGSRYDIDQHDTAPGTQGVLECQGHGDLDRTTTVNYSHYFLTKLDAGQLLKLSTAKNGNYYIDVSDQLKSPGYTPIVPPYANISVSARDKDKWAGMSDGPAMRYSRLGPLGMEDGIYLFYAHLVKYDCGTYLCSNLHIHESCNPFPGNARFSTMISDPRGCSAR